MRTSTDDRSNTSVNCSYASSSWASNIAKKDQHQAQRRITSTQTRTMRKPESTEAMGRGDDTKDDGQGKANGPGLIPIEGMRAA